MLRNQWNGCECNRKFHGSKDTGACRSQCADAAGTVGSAEIQLKKWGSDQGDYHWLKQFELVAAQKGIDVSKDPRRTELLRAKMKTQADIAESQKAVDRLEELVKRGENAKISVVRKVYSGCVVTIDQQTLTVKELQESVCFQKKKEGVVMISLK